MVRKSDGNTLFLEGKYAEAYDVYAATLDDYNVLFEAIVDVNDAMIFLQKQNLLANKGACRDFIRMAFPVSTPISHSCRRRRCSASGGEVGSLGGGPGPVRRGAVHRSPQPHTD